jgi:hypothetical protein
LYLSNLSTIIFEFSTRPILRGNCQADPAETFPTALASYMFATLGVLNDQVAVRTGPVSRGPVCLDCLFILEISQLEFLIPGTVF